MIALCRKCDRVHRIPGDCQHEAALDELRAEHTNKMQMMGVLFVCIVLPVIIGLVMRYWNCTAP